MRYKIGVVTAVSAALFLPAAPAGAAVPNGFFALIHGETCAVADPATDVVVGAPCEGEVAQWSYSVSDFAQLRWTYADGSTKCVRRDVANGRPESTLGMAECAATFDRSRSWYFITNEDPANPADYHLYDDPSALKHATGTRCWTPSGTEILLLPCAKPTSGETFTTFAADL